MLVAMPTAMPPAPFTSRLGNQRGQDEGLLLVPVVVGHEVDGLGVDVASISMAIGDSRASVYRMAAGRLAVDRAEVARGR